MNWKKEGYKVEQKVLVIRKGMFTRDISYHTGIISHVGTKKLVVDIDSKMQLIFTNDRECTGDTWGNLYTFYNNKEEYEEELANKKVKNELIADIKDNLNKLSIDKLNVILDIIKEDNDG